MIEQRDTAPQIVSEAGIYFDLSLFAKHTQTGFPFPGINPYKEPVMIYWNNGTHEYNLVCHTDHNGTIHRVSVESAARDHARKIAHERNNGHLKISGWYDPLPFELNYTRDRLLEKSYRF